MNGRFLLFVIEDTKGNKFGFYCSSNYDVIINNVNLRNTDSFIFSLQSNGRINGMQRFMMKRNTFAYLYFHRPQDQELFYLTSSFLINKRGINSYFWNSSSGFNLNGMKKPFSCGNQFIPKRILVIQMK